MLLKHNLHLAAWEMNIVPGLHSALVSMPKLADAGYTTVFSKNGAAIYNGKTTMFTATNPPVLELERCKHTGMWMLNLDPETTISNQEVPTASPETLNVIFDLPSARKTFLWYHASTGFPTKETFIDAVRKGNYATWPKLTITLINRYFPDSDKTIKGHLKGQRQGIRLTKNIALEKIIKNKQVRIKIEGENSHFHHIPITKTHKAFFCMEDLSNSIHTDQTSAFPFTSQRGNRYIMVASHLGTNDIFVKPMCSRSKEEMIRAYEKIINRMKAAGLGLRKHTLDNEALDAFKQYMRQQQIQFELVPPGNHTSNQAERVIQTFKAHFISIPAGIDDKFPLFLWCHLLEPTELTLNLLRQSKVAPKISAFAHVHGPHDYTKKPFAPLGCTIQAHVKLEDRRTWDPRADAGFSLGTSIQHHQCFWVYITKTLATRISDTVSFKHQYITNLMVSAESHVLLAAQQLATALKGNIPAGNETAEALKKVSKLFKKLAAAKNEAAKAKEQRNRVRATPAARKTTHFPRVEASIPRVAAGPEEDCCVEQIVANPSVPRPVAHPLATRSQSRSLRFDAQSPTARRPNYISQDERSTPSHETHHQISLQQHYSGSNAIMYGNIQASICLIIQLGHLKLCCNSAHGHVAHGHNPTDVGTQDTNDLVLQNDKFSDRRQRRTLGVSSPHSKPCHIGNLAALVRKRDQTT
jgi:hypothetical protein